MSIPFVLSIEDNEGDFALIVMALRECLDTVEVRQILDGEEAVTFFLKLAVAAATCPDLVLLDLNIPRRDGFEVLTFMKSLDLVREIPVVMFTSSRRSHDREKALFLGASEYISKPSSFNTMMALLEGVCARYLLHAQPEGPRPD